MKKNIPIILGIIATILLLSALWYSFFGSAPKLISNTNNASLTNASSSSDHFKLTPLTTDFVVDENASTRYGNEKVTLDSSEKLPVSTSFKSFAYDAAKGEALKISGSCSDTYYAIVIFQTSVDYKQKPDAAVFNQATLCPEDKKFSRTIELKDYNLPTGEYYFFVADQGKSGSWYNPR